MEEVDKIYNIIDLKEEIVKVFIFIQKNCVQERVVDKIINA